MKAPRKVSDVKMSPRLEKEMRRQEALKKLKDSVSFDQVWKHNDGTEYTTIVLGNQHVKSRRDDWPVMVTFYGPDGKYLTQSLDAFVQDKVFLRKYESVMTPAEEALGPWMSASLEDLDACAEFKTAVKNWFNELPFPILTKEVK